MANPVAHCRCGYTLLQDQDCPECGRAFDLAYRLPTPAPPTPQARLASTTWLSAGLLIGPGPWLLLADGGAIVPFFQPGLMRGLLVAVLIVMYLTAAAAGGVAVRGIWLALRLLHREGYSFACAVCFALDALFLCVVAYLGWMLLVG